MKQYDINLKANCWAVTVIKGDTKRKWWKRFSFRTGRISTIIFTANCN